MSRSRYSLRDEPVDNPLEGHPEDLSDTSMSSGYTPDPSPGRPGTVDIPGPSRLLSTPQEKGKTKVREDVSNLINPERDVHFAKVDDYPGCNHPNVTSEKLIGEMLEDFNFPASHFLMTPTRRQRLYHTPPYKENGQEIGTHWVGIARQCFRCGLRLPLNKFVASLLKHMGIGIGQLTPNCFTTINAFLAQCVRRNVDPNLKFFWYTFRLGRDSQAGFYTLSRRPGKVEWVKKHSNNKGWTSDWCYVYGTDLTFLPGWFPLNPTTFDEVPVLSPEEVKEYWKFATLKRGEKVWGPTDFRDQEWLEKYTGQSRMHTL